MRSLTRNIALTIGIVAFLLSSIDIQAATPAPPLGSTYTGGLFAEYFQNAVSNDCPIEDGYILKGFSGGMNTYMRPDCAIGLWESDGSSQVWSKRNLHGFGTTNPQYTLDLSGSLRLSLPSGVGDSLVLTSDSNGVASWTSIPATCTPKGSGTGSLCQGIGTLQSVLNTSNNNVGLGDSVMTVGLTGGRNVGVGYSALRYTTNGAGNTAIGTESMATNSSGGYNVAIGNRALQLNTTASSNVAIGSATLQNNTIGGLNTAVGRSAMNFNTSGNYNSALGYSAMYNNTTGTGNTALGYGSMYNNTVGVYNTAIGYNSLNNAIGGYNIAIGVHAGDNLISGTGNIVIGQYADVPNNNDSYQLSIGNVIYGTGMTSASSGLISIGSRFPTNKLHVRNDVNSPVENWIIRLQNNNGDAQKPTAGLLFSVGGDTDQKSGIIFKRTAGWGRGNIYFVTDNTADSSLPSIDTDTAMTIGANGNILIGGSGTVSNKLEVLGAAIKVKNDTGYASQIRFGTPVDQNGVIQYSTGVLDFYTKNVLRMSIGSGGNIGIGTTSPGAKLTVGANLGGTALSTSFKTNAGALGGAWNDELSIASIGFTSSNSSALGIRAIRTANSPDDWTTAGIVLGMDVDNTVRASSAYLMLHPNGSIGVGKTNPSVSYKLDVAGTGAFQSIDAGKSISFAQPNPFIQFNSGGPTISLPSANNLAISTSGVERMRVDNNGNIGIADTTPSYKLDVAGTGAFMGLRVTVGASSGKVLTSDTTGNATWQSLPSGLPIGIAGNTMYHNGTAWVASSNIYNNNGNVGIGTTSPGAKLTVGANLGGTALSTSFKTNAGALGGNLNDELSIASIGFTSSNSSALGIRAIRTANSPDDWTTAGIVLGMDVDNTARASSAYLMLHPNGSIGVGKTNPSVSYKLDVAGTGAFLGLRLTSGASAGKVLTSDTTGNATWQSLPSGLPIGIAGNTMYHNGTAWVASSNIYNNNGNVGIGINPAEQKLQVAGNILSSGGDSTGYKIKNSNGNYWGVGTWGNRLEWYRTVSGTNYWAQLTSENGKWKFGGYADTAGALLQVGGNQKIDLDLEVGSTTTEYLPAANNWNYTLQLNAQDTSSIGFHDASANVSSIRYRNKLFTIGGDDGWGVANVLAPGTVTSAGFIYSSDRNLKKDITPLSDSLSKITSLNGYSFVWKKTGIKDIGVIAQEVEKVFPDIVHTDAETGMKSVEYGNLIAPVIEAIKSQQQIIEEQNTRIQSLEARLEALEAKMK